ncbi:Os09g0328600 [Oryza sativa Japonica Group]|uniref:Ankyrin-like protein n=3 Tax=Oryza sativa TaxID=4530 RepID=Q6K2M7_ORYSJ|nr:ankyrin-like protein [Oryza sativa Japonica Group]BAH94507.1 Os09g0328600 [Oryza sativa Japonica Group]|eukprot:NP_001175779.1 Os09g0328600 [Oryza sativa Japonica Group]
MDGSIPPKPPSCRQPQRETHNNSENTGATGNDQAQDEGFLLHVVAANGDGENYRKCATLLSGMDKTRLFARNSENKTALECAANAGYTNMVFHLLDMERKHNFCGLNTKPNEILKKTSGRSETPLHEAVRQRCERKIEELKGKDSGLARVPDINGMSPLYLAIPLGYRDIVDKLTLTFGDANLSYDGPNGQNVLHAAALQSAGRRGDLMNKADWSGSTPLHFAASVGVQGVTTALLDGIDQDRRTDYTQRPDNNGMFPIHIAASVGSMDTITSLVNADQDCATLRDNVKGRTLLHIAIENRKYKVVKLVCKDPRFKETLNLEDNDGNTALHLAVKKRDEYIFTYLLQNKAVELNHVNLEGYTPLDLAKVIRMEDYFASPQNPTEWMVRVLAHSGAVFSPRRRDELIRGGSSQEQEKHGKTLSESTESVLVASALIATLTFAAAFTMPGSYRTTGPKEGTPALGALYGFKVFLVADILAFFCSVAATFSLAEYGNRGTVDPLVRCRYSQRAVWLFHVALRSIIVAFAFGVSVVMWNISLSAISIGGVATIAVVFYGNVPLGQDFRLMLLMHRRFGFSRSWNLYPSTASHLNWTSWQLKSFSATLVWNLMNLFWTYVLIFALAGFAQLKQKH